MSYNRDRVLFLAYSTILIRRTLLGIYSYSDRHHTIYRFGGPAGTWDPKPFCNIAVLYETRAACSRRSLPIVSFLILAKGARELGKRLAKNMFLQETPSRSLHYERRCFANHYNIHSNNAIVTLIFYDFTKVQYITVLICISYDIKQYTLYIHTGGSNIVTFIDENLSHNLLIIYMYFNSINENICVVSFLLKQMLTKSFI